MEQTDFSPSDSLKTWGLLVALLLVGTLAVALGLPRGLALWVIFAAAIAEAYVIGRYYMRLRSEGRADLPSGIASGGAGHRSRIRACSGHREALSRRSDTWLRQFRFVEPLIPNAAPRLAMAGVPVPWDRQGEPIRRWVC